MATTKKTTPAKATETTTKTTAAKETAPAKATEKTIKETTAKAPAKKAPAKKAPAKKAAPKKVAPKKPAAVAAATATKTAPAKAEAPAETKVDFFIEFGGVQVSVDEVIKNIKIANGKDAKNIAVYLKPEESKAYFVADGEEKEMDVFFC